MLSYSVRLVGKWAERRSGIIACESVLSREEGRSSLHSDSLTQSILILSGIRSQRAEWVVLGVLRSLLCYTD